MANLTIEDCDEIIANPKSSLSQLLAISLKRQLRENEELKKENEGLKHMVKTMNAFIEERLS